MTKYFANKKFTFNDQRLFADISGDHNPIHLDQVAARRLFFGRAAVHGINSVLWALDEWLKTKNNKIRISSLDFTFHKAIGVDENVELVISEDADGKVCFEFMLQGAVQAWLNCYWEFDDFVEGSFFKDVKPRDCQKHQLADLRDAKGRVELELANSKKNNLFPEISKKISNQQVAILLSSTRLVGMECPGKNSAYVGLNIKFKNSEKDTHLNYKVSFIHKELSLVLIDVFGNSFEGTIKSFVRPEPINQVTYQDVQSKIKPNEFSNQKPLVIGGSRGLGEVTVKILAAGGADVAFTYHQGNVEADNLTNNIQLHGGQASSFCLDVNHITATPNSLPELPFTPTHLYYFVTPYIFLGNNTTYQNDLYQKFHSYYVDGLEHLVKSIWQDFKGPKKIFYPSSVAVDESIADMKEYADAKREGEQLCEKLNASGNNYEATIYRFPRISTDQTAGLIKGDEQNALPLLLSCLRNL